MDEEGKAVNNRYRKDLLNRELTLMDANEKETPLGSAIRVYSRLFAVLFILPVVLLVAPLPAQAHVGSPDVFFDGQAGPYPVQVVIRMPPVVPGRAHIEVRPKTHEALAVSFLPLFSKTSIQNAPPAEIAQTEAGDPTTYEGELWLMSVGAYTIEVRLKGAAGEGVARIPVNSVATHQLPLPAYLRNLLIVLGALLGFGCVAIVFAASGECVLEPGASMQRVDRRRGLIAGAVTALILALALVGGWHWWQAEEEHFRRNLRAGAWPDLTAKVETAGNQRILHLTIGEKAFNPTYGLPLLPDHGKLLHLFLIREPACDVFAHVHPIRRGGKNFDLLLPEIPEGKYRIFCDLTLSDSGVSSTASSMVEIPAVRGEVTSPSSSAPLHADPDDSWFIAPPHFIPSDPISTDYNSPVVSPLAGGCEAIWKTGPSLHARHDAHLEFVFRDAAGQPLPLEPYMGMMSHAAILRDDGAVFAHLHPTGNYSMASLSFFDAKIAREMAGTEGGAAPVAMDHSKMHHGAPGDAAPASITIPYEFPSPGHYHIWVQAKSRAQVLTAAFGATVAP